MIHFWLNPSKNDGWLDTDDYDNIEWIPKNSNDLNYLSRKQKYE